MSAYKVNNKHTLKHCSLYQHFARVGVLYYTVAARRGSPSRVAASHKHASATAQIRRR